MFLLLYYAFFFFFVNNLFQKNAMLMLSSLQPLPNTHFYRSKFSQTDRFILSVATLVGKQETLCAVRNLLKYA